MRETEVKYIATEDEITVYWERTENMAAGERFRIFLGGKEADVTEKTHCTLSGLTSQRRYEIQVIGGEWHSEVLAVSTGKQKRRIDITAAPYLAVGDGAELNTERIQRAIDDCGAEDAVYVPEGIFFTGALRLHSNMELYLEEGAVLQGTADVSDYLPKIPSRFEGIEMQCYSSVLNLGNLQDLGSAEAAGDGGEAADAARPEGAGDGGKPSDAENPGTAEHERELTDAENPEAAGYGREAAGAARQEYAERTEKGQNSGEALKSGRGARQDFVCENVVIRGRGTIASGGRLLAERVIAREREELGEKLEQMGELVAECECAETVPGRVRPRLVNISRCRHVLLSGVTFRNGASWNVHMIYSSDIVTHGCTFVSQEVWNGDGWDPDSSEGCTIFDCDFHTGDDGIAIKSGKNPQGNKIGIPCRNIRIFDCRSAFGHGITIGSEMSGGVEDVAVWDCDLSRSVYGLEIKGTWKRGGYVKGIRVDNCRLPRLLFHEVGYNNDGEPADRPPVFSDCVFRRMEILGAYYNRQREWTECEAIELRGFEQSGHEVADICFEDLVLGREGGAERKTISLTRCRGLQFKNLRVL